MTEIETSLTIDVARIKSNSSPLSTQGGVADIEGVSETPPGLEQCVSNASDRDFLGRFSQLSKSLNQQLAGSQETIIANHNTTD